MTTFNGGGLAIGPVGNEFASFTYNSTGNSWYSNIPIQTSGDVLCANLIANGYIVNTGNITTGDITSYGNINMDGTELTGNGFSIVNGTALFGNSVTTIGDVTVGGDLIAHDLTLGNAVTVTANATVLGTLFVDTNLNVTGATQTGLLFAGDTQLGNLTADATTMTSAVIAGFTIADNIITGTDEIVIDPGPPGPQGLLTVTAANTNLQGAVTATGAITAPTYYGDGSNLTGLAQDVPTGALMMWATATAPTGYLLCNGQAVSRITYASLYNTIGTTFGIGDGSSTFNLPNYVNNFPVGAGGAYALASTGGSPDATLVSHTHAVTDPGHQHYSYGSGAYNGGGAGAAIGTSGNSPGPVQPATTGITVGLSGSSPTNANLPPYLAINFIIKT